MEIVEVGKLLKGVGVIIDDAATNEGNMEYHMVKSIIAAGVPMAVFTYIPETSVIDSLGNISFIILDWEFSREIPEEFDGLEMGDEFKKDQKDTILSFLKVLLWELIKQYTVSFIFLIYGSITKLVGFGIPDIAPPAHV